MSIARRRIFHSHSSSDAGFFVTFNRFTYHRDVYKFNLRRNKQKRKRIFFVNLEHSSSRNSLSIEREIFPPHRRRRAYVRIKFYKWHFVEWVKIYAFKTLTHDFKTHRWSDGGVRRNLGYIFNFVKNQKYPKIN